MSDLMTRLAEARPTDAELDRMWSPDARAGRLDGLLTTPRSRVGSRTRRLSLVAAAVALAAATVPTVLDSGDASAADLRALARAAVRYDGPVLAEGTWLHERSTSLQRNSSLFSDGEVYDNERETWTSWDGTLYIVEHRPSAGWTSYDVLDERFRPSIGDPTPAFSATLPDEPDALRDYLDDHVSGSNSHDEALFEAVRTLTTSHTLPPRTLAAALEVLAEIDGVSTDDVVVGGRPAVEATFTQHYLDALGTSTIVLDRATGQVLSEESADPQRTYRSTTTLSEVVEVIPAEVLAEFATYGDGGITCESDRPDCSIPR